MEDNDDSLSERIHSFISRKRKLLKRTSLAIVLVGFVLMVTGATTGSTTEPMFIVGICMLLFGLLFGSYVVYQSRNDHDSPAHAQESRNDQSQNTFTYTLHIPNIHDILDGNYFKNMTITTNNASASSEDNVFIIDQGRKVYVYGYWKSNSNTHSTILDDALASGAPIITDDFFCVEVNGTMYFAHLLKEYQCTLQSYLKTHSRESLVLVTQLIDSMIKSKITCELNSLSDVVYQQNIASLYLLRVETIDTSNELSKQDLYNFFIRETSEDYPELAKELAQARDTP